MYLYLKYNPTTISKVFLEIDCAFIVKTPLSAYRADEGLQYYRNRQVQLCKRS
jgi:hypothetical protein